MARAQIQSLQVFRGLAALAVVAHHAAASTEAFVGGVPPAVASVIGLGYLGVDFFFVLSGFIIMYAHMDDERSFAAVRRYSFKRLVRIFPAYLPISLGLILLYAALPGFSGAGGREYSLVSSIFLVPADQPPALSVAWTLVHELLFYGVFLLCFLSRRWFGVALLAWAVVIGLSSLQQEPEGWLRYPLSPLNIEFMMGVLAAWLAATQFRERGHQWLVACGIAVAFSTLVMMDQTGGANTMLRLVFALSLAAMIVGFARWEKSVSFFWPHWCLLIGNASFSIYLIHNPLLSVTQRLAGSIGLSWVVALVFGVLMSVVAGYLYHMAVERPALRLFKSKLGRVSRPAQPVGH